MKMRELCPELYSHLQLVKMNLRHCGIAYRPTRNKPLMKYKGIHKGKRCFIIATGPSLTVDDLELIKNEYCIGVNSCIKAFSKTDWRPTYLCISDQRVWDSIGREVDSVTKEIETLFLGRPGIKSNSENVVYFSRDERPSTYIETEFYKKYKKKNEKYDFYISQHMNRYFCDGPTVVFTAIQLAIYMGFSEIYLLGTDCNYTGGNAYSTIAQYQNEIRLPDDVENKLFGGYRAVKRDIEKYGLNTTVYNATRGGKLEVFPRRTLESILQKENGR